MATPSGSQTLQISVREAELAGVKLRKLSGRVVIGASDARAEHRSGAGTGQTVSATVGFTIDDPRLSPQPVTTLLHGHLDAAGWRLRLMPLTLPLAIVPDMGPTPLHISGEIFGQRLDAITSASFEVNVDPVSYADASGSTAIEGVGLKAQLSLRPLKGMTHSLFELQAQSIQGEALFGPVYLDLQQHPIDLRLAGEIESLSPVKILVDSVQLKQRGLLDLVGRLQARIAIEPDLQSKPSMTIDQAQIELQSLEFPAAYSSFLRTPLAGSLLGNLRTEGHVSAQLTIQDGLPIAADVFLHELGVRDLRSNALTLAGLTGTLHWRAAGPTPAPISQLGWTAGSLNGIPAGAAELKFLWQADNIRLTEASRIPVLDGALRIESLTASNLLGSSRDIDFDGSLEPVSLPALTQALGWPSLGGTLTGRAPGLRYRDGRITINGALETEIFGGRVVGRNLTLEQPFSRWPRLTADIDLESLDLALLSSTLDIGAITGRVGGRIEDLELFGWKPVAFDARIATLEDAPDPRRISVRAINSLANLGGTAGSGVSAALQAGFLRFFDTYKYRRLGLRCTLRDDVCLMSGANANQQRAGDRYVLLEGAGLPRLDIIGYSGRVKWSQLVEQITTQIRSGGAAIRVP